MAPASCTAGTRTSAWWSTGAGGWCTSGSKVSSRCSPPPSSRFSLHALGLLSAGLAAQASLLAAVLYLAGGIIGTNHHLYFSGTPTAALAWGATLSALEVVPLVLIGYQAMKDLKISRRTEWARKYRWPIYFFIAVGFWNLVGAGIFGFMINPPIAL